jgi:TldD protein
MNLPKCLPKSFYGSIHSLNFSNIFKTALENGGEFAELFFEETVSTRVVLEGGRVDQVSDGIDRGIGLRVLFEGHSVYGYTTDLTQNAVMKLAQTLSDGVA